MTDADLEPDTIAKAISLTVERELDNNDSAHPRACVRRLRQDFPELVEAESERLLDKALHERFRNALNKTAGAAGQMVLPGLGAIDRTITIPDGEGDFAFKRIEKATADDLIADASILRENANSATRAAARAEQRNEVLLPLMEKHGFETASEAIAFLMQSEAVA